MTALGDSLLVCARFLDLTPIRTRLVEMLNPNSSRIDVLIQTKDLSFGLISPQLRRGLGVQLGENILQYGLIVGAPSPKIKARSCVHFPIFFDRLPGLFSDFETLYPIILVMCILDGF